MNIRGIWITGDIPKFVVGEQEKHIDTGVVLNDGELLLYADLATINKFNTCVFVGASDKHINVACIRNDSSVALNAETGYRLYVTVGKVG